MTTQSQSDEHRVKEVYPDAHQDAYSPAIWASDSRQTLLVIGKNWHDAASRLPKSEAVPDDCLDITDDGKVIIAASPAKEPAPQTFEEWESPVEGEFEVIHNGLRQSVVPLAVHKRALAKASSPAVAGGESETLVRVIKVLERAARFITKVDDLHQTIYSNGLDEDCEEAIALLKPFIKDVRGKE